MILWLIQVISDNIPAHDDLSRCERNVQDKKPPKYIFHYLCVTKSLLIITYIVQHTTHIDNYLFHSPPVCSSRLVSGIEKILWGWRESWKMISMTKDRLHKKLNIIRYKTKYNIISIMAMTKKEKILSHVHI